LICQKMFKNIHLKIQQKVTIKCSQMKIQSKQFDQVRTNFKRNFIFKLLEPH
jgi:hypothetical protein